VLGLGFGARATGPYRKRVGCVNITWSPEGLAVKKIEKIPQSQKVWGWEIALDLYLAGTGAGAYCVGLLLDWKWNLTLFVDVLGHPLNLGKAALLWGPIFVAMSTPFLIVDLGIKRRFLYACLNPKTSWVARGFLILSTFLILGLLVLGASVFFPETFGNHPVLWRFLKALSLLFAILTTLYTGILLKSVRYVPLWNTFLLPILFVTSAFLTGTAGIVLAMGGSGVVFPSAKGPVHGASRVLPLVWGLIIIEGLLLVKHLHRTSQHRGEGMISVRLLLSGKLKVLFWGGIVFLGFFLPIVLQLIYFGSHTNPPWILTLTGISLLVSGFFLRWGVLASGVKEKHPMEKLLEIRANLNAPKFHG
jgi:polysulfide reductase chain C